MKAWKAFASGLLVGGLLLGGTVEATVGLSSVTAQVASFQYWLDGHKVVTSPKEGQIYNGKEYLPAGLVYKGTTYVPLRFFGEATGNGVQYVAATRSIEIQSPQPLEGAYPAKVNEWIEASKPVELGQTMNVAGQTYILVTRGEKPSTGYDIKILSVVERDKDWLVTVDYTDPKPDAMVGMAMTYPYAVWTLPQTDKPFTFAEKDGEYIPRVVGASHYPFPEHEKNSDAIKLLTISRSSSVLAVEGLARIFEATISYQLLKAGSGEGVLDGFVTAQSGAPDWGYFQVKLDTSKLAKGDYVLELFETSAKDGSAVHTVKIPYTKQ